MNPKIIFNKVSKLLKNSDKLWINRKRKIDTTLLFNILSKTFINNNGIKHTISYNSINNKYFISDAALCNARKKCDYTIFNNIKHKLIDSFAYKNNIYAADGSKIRLPYSFYNEGFTTRSSKSKNILGMISTIFDVKNKIPINTLLTTHFNERKAIIEQLKFVKKNSILIFDRGYYSKKLIKSLEDNNIKYLFRLKRDANKKINMFYKNTKSRSKKIRINNIKVKLFKYNINKITYLCCTNIFNTTMSYLKKLYKLRWSVEDGFKIMKSTLNLKHIHSRSRLLLNQEIAIRELIYTISRLIQNNIIILKKFYHTSLKLIIKFMVNNFSYLIKHFNIFIKLIQTTLFKSIPNRTRIVNYIKK